MDRKPESHESAYEEVSLLKLAHDAACIRPVRQSGLHHWFSRFPVTVGALFGLSATRIAGNGLQGFLKGTHANREPKAVRFRHLRKYNARY